MRFTPIQSHAAYLEHVASNREQWQVASALQQSTVPGKAGRFAVKGYCVPCGAERSFWSFTPGDRVAPNWREELVCETCGLNNRTRALLDFASKTIRPESSLYITEQKTAFYRYLAERFPGVRGSEFLGSDLPSGQDMLQEIDNQDLTALTYADESFDHVFSLDVLEHVPDYKLALREIRRCLRKGGTFLLTVPFAKHSPSTTVRAILRDGQVEHLATPEYHGDPNNPEGCLAFYTFSWPLIADLEEAGFTNVFAQVYWSREHCYFGAAEQLLVSASA